MRRVKSEEDVADLGTKPLSKAVNAKHCLTGLCQHGRRKCSMITTRRGDVLELQFGSHLAAAASG